jgi:anti-anti-sigma factor
MVQSLVLREPIIIAPEGELDLATLGEFRRQLFQATREQTDGVLVDFTDVSFIDSSALSALFELQARLRRVSRQLAVVAPRGTAVSVVLGLTGLHDRLPIYETREAALES